MKDLSKIIKEFERFPYKGYVQKSPKHEPTDIYFYIARHLNKCMMRADAFNLHVYPVRMEMTDTQQIPISHVWDSEDKESKEIIEGANQKALSSIQVLWRIANKKLFTKVSTQIRNKMQLMKQRMSNLRLQIIQ